MYNVDVLIDIFFKDLPFPKRVGEIAKCGYQAIESWQGGDAELLKEVGDACGDTGVQFVSIVMNGVGDDAVAPSRKGNFEAFVERIDKYTDNALAAGCRSGIVTAGNIVEGQSDDEHDQCLVECLKAGGELAAKKNFILNLEPLNTLVDHQGYYLDSRERGVEIIKKVDLPNVKLLYDIYHMEIMTGNQVAFLLENVSHLGHFHVAGVPGRHEPFNGETNYPFILDQVVAAGYGGHFGLEYFPALEDHAESLRKTREYLGEKN